MDPQVAGQIEMMVDSDTEVTNGANNDVERMRLLEFEIHTLTCELEEESSKNELQQVECEKHLGGLHSAQEELARCQEVLKEQEQKLNNAVAKAQESEKKLLTAEEDLMRNKQLMQKSKKQRDSVIEQMESQITTNGKFHDELKKTISKQSDQLANSEERYAELEHQYAEHSIAMTDETVRLQESHDKEKVAFTRRIQELELQRKELETDLHKSRPEGSEMEDLRRIIRGVHQEKNERLGELAKLEEKLSFKDAKIVKLSGDVEALQTKLRKMPGLATKLAKLESATSSLQNHKREMQRDGEARQKAFEEERAFLKKTVAELQNRNAALAQETASSKAALAEEKRKIASIETDLESKTSAISEELERTRGAILTAQEENRESANRIATLESEKAELDRRTSKSEHRHRARERHQVREQDPTLGVIFCIDISGSLVGPPEQMAKDAFREIIESLRSTYPSSHVGIIVHARTVSIIRKMKEIDPNVDGVLDDMICGGCEDYHTAFALAETELSSFAKNFPGARRSVIIISDGEDSGDPADVSTFEFGGIPCHNVVVEKPRSSSASYVTERYASATGGRNVRFTGRLCPEEIPQLISP